MRTQVIQQILASNPDALFHVSWTHGSNWHNRRIDNVPVQRVARLHIHPQFGHLMATAVGIDQPHPSFADSIPMRVEARNVIRLYEQPSDDN